MYTTDASVLASSFYKGRACVAISKCSLRRPTEPTGLVEISSWDNFPGIDQTNRRCGHTLVKQL